MSIGVHEDSAARACVAAAPARSAGLGGLSRRLLRGLRFGHAAARALTRFWASLARFSADIGRRFFATFFAAFLVVDVALRAALDVVGRPTAGATLATSTSPPPRSRATIAAWYGFAASTISTVVRLSVTR